MSPSTAIHGGALDNTELSSWCRPGHYFMMGDNRDNSDDSRAAVGYVPADNLEGKALFRFFSTDGSGAFLGSVEVAIRGALLAHPHHGQVTLCRFLTNSSAMTSAIRTFCKPRADACIGANAVNSNERLEFLGDRVLGAGGRGKIARAAIPHEDEGALTRRKWHMPWCAGEACARAAKRCRLVLIRSGADPLGKIGGRPGRAGRDPGQRVCEAVIAALYLDGGMDVARSFMSNAGGLRCSKTRHPIMRDAKTRLQEWAQARGKDSRRAGLYAEGTVPVPIMRRVLWSKPR